MQGLKPLLSLCKVESKLFHSWPCIYCLVSSSCLWWFRECIPTSRLTGRSVCLFSGNKCRSERAAGPRSPKPTRPLRHMPGHRRLLRPGSKQLVQQLGIGLIWTLLLPHPLERSASSRPCTCRVVTRARDTKRITRVRVALRLRSLDIRKRPQGINATGDINNKHLSYALLRHRRADRVGIKLSFRACFSGSLAKGSIVRYNKCGWVIFRHSYIMQCRIEIPRVS